MKSRSSKRLRRTRWKLALLLGSLVVSVIFCEVLLRIFFPADTISKYNEVHMPVSSSGTKKHFVSRRYQPKRAHPYIGFVYNDKLIDGINSDGFRDSHQFPYKRQSDEFVIGVFGGSFASDFAETQEFKINERTPGFDEKIKALVPRLKNKKITVLNFGLASGRQPQQFIAISLYLETLDMVLIIDGFNEAYRNRDLDFPTYYPDYAKFFFSKDGAYSALWKTMFNIRQNQRHWAAYLAENSFWGHSQIVYQLWNIHNLYVDRQTKHLIEQEAAQEDFPEGLTKDEYNRLKADIWLKYARLQDNMLKSEKVPYVHILQPNQYLPGTKPLSEEEKEKFMWPTSPTSESMLESYGMIMADQKKLYKMGYNVLDFTRIFQDHPETLYRDRCCHINRSGIDLLEEALAKEVAKALGT